MSFIIQDVRYALRSLVRQPGFTVVATITLALGIGATTAIFSVVNSVLLESLPFANSDRIVTLWQRDRTTPREVELSMVSTPNFKDWQAASTSFTAMAQYRGTNITLSTEHGAELVAGGEVTAEFFRVFGAEPIMGRAFTDAEVRYMGPQVAIVSHSFWQDRLGGRADVIGQTLRLQGKSYQVIGVAPERFEYPNGARIWLPIQRDETGCGRGCALYVGIGLLRPGVTVERARADIAAIAQRLEHEYPRENTGFTGDVATLHEVIIGDVKLALLVVFCAVGMVLLIACANVAHLMLVRGTARRMEIVVRAVLGAGRRRLLGQLITESAVIALVGSALGALLALWGIEVLAQIAPESFPRVAEIDVDARTLLFGFMMAGLTILLFGVAPALHLSAAPFAQTLREGGRGTTDARQRARLWILGAEVALSVTLLLGAGLMLRSLVRMRAVDPGFDATGVAQFRVSLPDARYPDPALAVRFVQDVQQQLAALPGVESAGYILGLPLSGIHIVGGFTRPDQPAPAPGQGPLAAYRAIDPHYLTTMRVPLLAGRNFQPGDRAGSLPVAIIDAELAQRYFAGEDPIGKQINVQVSTGYDEALPRTIVGVIGSVRARSLTEKPEPALYVPDAQTGGGFGHFVVRSARDANDVLREARTTVASVDPQIPLMRPGTMDDLLASHRAQQTFYVLLLGLFAVLAITLAAVGVYGVVAFAVAQRTREIGVRMALGARAQQVVSLVVWQGLRPTIVGALIGIAGALAAGGAVSSLLYEVAPEDPVTLIGVAILLLAVVALACSVPAYRVTRIPPAAALRAE
jgi:putative ABC transport system permease protein